MSEEFLERLRKEAYDSLDVQNHEVDLQGWMCGEFERVFQGCLQLAGPSPLVIEVGSWKGRSAVAMASASKDATIIAVDTWLGAPEFWTWGLDDPTRGGSFRSVHGYPQVFYTFTKNVKSLGFHDRICPLPLSSVQAADVLGFYEVLADIVYIDAAHEAGQVLCDIEAFWRLLRPGGMMLGDDYCDGWPGVVHAVDDFASRHGLTVRVDGVVWALHKH